MDRNIGDWLPLIIAFLVAFIPSAICTIVQYFKARKKIKQQYKQLVARKQIKTSSSDKHKKLSS